MRVINSFHLRPLGKEGFALLSQFIELSRLAPLQFFFSFPDQSFSFLFGQKLWLQNFKEDKLIILLSLGLSYPLCFFLLLSAAGEELFQ